MKSLLVVTVVTVISISLLGCGASDEVEVFTPDAKGESSCPQDACSTFCNDGVLPKGCDHLRCNCEPQCPEDPCAIVCAGEALPEGCGDPIRCSCEPQCPEDPCAMVCAGQALPEGCGDHIRCRCEPQCPEDPCAILCNGGTLPDGCGENIRCGCQLPASDCAYAVVDDKLALCDGDYRYMRFYQSQQPSCDAYWAVGGQEGRPTVEGAMSAAGCDLGCVWNPSVAVMFLHCGHRSGYILFSANGCDDIYELPGGYYRSVEEWEAENPCN